MTVSAVSPRMRRMQWVAIGLATAAIALNYIDRSTLAISNLTIRQEFDINATAIGALQSFWSLTYACCQIPVGFLLDRLGPRYLVGLALVAWSVAQAAGGLAATYTHLMWARIALGGTESPAFPGAVRVTSDWFPHQGQRQANRRVQLRRQYWPGDRAAAADRPDAKFRLANHVHHHGRRWTGRCAGLVQAVSRSSQDSVGTARSGLPCGKPRGRGAGGAAQLGQAVPISLDVGPHAGRILQRLRGMDVPDLAAGIPRNAAAYQYRKDRLRGDDPAVVLGVRCLGRRLDHRSVCPRRHGDRCKPAVARDPGAVGVGAVHHRRHLGHGWGHRP